MKRLSLGVYKFEWIGNLGGSSRTSTQFWTQNIIVVRIDGGELFS